MLFIHHDDSQLVQGGEDGRAGADDDCRLAPADAAPLVVALPRGQAAVQHRDAAGKTAAEAPYQLRRESDFRCEHQRGFSCFHGVADGLQVDFRFAAAGDAVEEERGELSCCHR